MSTTTRQRRQARLFSVASVGLAIGILVVPIASRRTAARPIATDRIGAKPDDQAWRASLRFDAIGTLRGGATGRPHVEIVRALGVGETTAQDLIAGDHDDPSLCNVGFVVNASTARPIYHWHLEARVLETSATHTTVAISGRRTRPDVSGAVDDVELTRTLTLAPDEYHTLDFVSASGTDSACTSTMVRVWAEPLPPPGVRVPIVSDVWLVHAGPLGESLAYQRIAGSSSEPLSFHVGPLAWPVATTGVGANAPPKLQIEVTGSISATLRPDGLVDVSTRAVQTFSWAGYMMGGEGRQDFRSRPGEVVALLFPNPGGTIRAAKDMPPDLSLARGVTRMGQQTVIALSEYFGDSQVALYVQVGPRGPE